MRWPTAWNFPMAWPQDESQQAELRKDEEELRDADPARRRLRFRRERTGPSGQCDFHSFNPWTQKSAMLRA